MPKFLISSKLSINKKEFDDLSVGWIPFWFKSKELTLSKVSTKRYVITLACNENFSQASCLRTKSAFFIVFPRKFVSGILVWTLLRKHFSLLFYHKMKYHLVDSLTLWIPSRWCTDFSCMKIGIVSFVSTDSISRSFI